MRYPVNQIFISQGFSKNHKGIDLGYFDNPNMPVYAIESGVVIAIQKQKSGGNVIHIKHDNGYVSEYAHLKDNSIKVKKGTCVLKGEQIALMGNTGKVSGYHLHLGLYKGKAIDYNHKEYFVNPIPYLCAWSFQTVYKKTEEIYKINHTKRATGIPPSDDGNYMFVRYKNGKIVGKIYNGEEVEYFGKWNPRPYLCLVDNIKEYTTVDKYLC